MHLRAESTTGAGAEVQVSWDFGSGPGRTSNFYVGKRQVPVHYDTPECMSRFTLERATYEFAEVVKNGKPAPGGPPFVMLFLRKHFAGDFAQLPKITFLQTKYDAKTKRPAGTTEQVFPFREKKMAAPVSDWTRSDLDISLGVPGAVMDLHNPMEWERIEVQCE